MAEKQEEIINAVHANLRRSLEAEASEFIDDELNDFMRKHGKI